MVWSLFDSQPSAVTQKGSSAGSRECHEGRLGADDSNSGSVSRTILFLTQLKTERIIKRIRCLLT